MISIAIPAYNEEDTIEHLLLSLYSQTVDKHSIEVFIADNASTDKTKKVIQLFKKKHPLLSVSIVPQPIHGIAPTRKCALDNAAKNNPDHILTIDADCVLPPTLITDTLALINKRTNAVVSYPLTYSKLFLMMLHIYYKPLKHVVSRIHTLQERLLGPSVYTGCLLVPTQVYRSLYWEDVLHPIISDDDFLISRRLNALGVPIIQSTITIPTSDRRFWGNITEWTQHKHEKDFRQIKQPVFHKPTPRDIEKAIELRIVKASQRIIQSLVEYMFLSSLPHTQYKHAKPIAVRAIRQLSLPENVFRPVSREEKMHYYKKLNHRYGSKINAFVTKWATT